MLKQPEKKYRRMYQAVNLPNRQWPSRQIDKAPIWMSTDLRDGNQAIFEPMTIEQKLKMFNMLVSIGFKQIEIGFPSASQIDFDFTRLLIEKDLIPDDVIIEILSPARDSFIERSFQALKGAKQAIFHIYNATSPTFRQQVLNVDQAQCLALAVNAAKTVKSLADSQTETQWTFEYSPETFTATELDFSKKVCDAVCEIWQASVDHPVILNLPATVEVASPNVYADQIEWMDRNLANRDAVILSVHPHNDRGCGVAAAELAMLAGADRVEGCVFGNGERTGNVDLAVLALNLYSQGISPNLDFSDINSIIATVEECTGLPVHPRHPYAGDLVFTAFSGSHQDAIKKGFAQRNKDDVWDVPYLPLDPQDLGRSYDAIIRVNSQSGKGGISYLLEHHYDVSLPRRAQIEFSQVVQRHSDQYQSEVSAEQIWDLFVQYYQPMGNPDDQLSYRLHEQNQVQHIELEWQNKSQKKTYNGQGNGPISAILNALAYEFDVVSYEEKSISHGASAKALAVIEIRYKSQSLFGVGIHDNIVTASLNAILSCAHRLGLNE